MMMNSPELSLNEDLSDDDGGAFDTLDTNLPSSSTLTVSQEDTLHSSTRIKNGRFTRITEDQTTENYVKTFDGFFQEMMGKVKTLKNAPALESRKQSNPVDEEKLFSHLKETPEVKEKLDYIKGLDEEIKNVIDMYKIEKAERMQTQLEMCQEMQKNNLPDRETALFLNLCNFELSEASDKIEEEDSFPTKSGAAGPDRFVKKNIELAREGFMANVSLTDEEKSKIEDLLRDEDNGESEPVAVEEGGDYVDSNAYLLTAVERSRMRDIDSELEKFTVDEKLNEKDGGGNQDYGTMSDFLLEQNIKRLEKKLNELHDEDINENSRDSYLAEADDDDTNIDGNIEY